jgi:hypothetical protein
MSAIRSPTLFCQALMKISSLFIVCNLPEAKSCNLPEDCLFVLSTFLILLFTEFLNSLTNYFTFIRKSELHG